jgi:hypothetical protein
LAIDAAPPPANTITPWPQLAVNGLPPWKSPIGATIWRKTSFRQI